MSRLTVRLPETLHHQLAAQAKREGVSLNQYVVYALTRQLTQSYTVQRMSEETVAQQQSQPRRTIAVPDRNHQREGRFQGGQSEGEQKRDAEKPRQVMAEQLPRQGQQRWSHRSERSSRSPFRVREPTPNGG